MATADDLIEWHAENQLGMVEVARIVTSADDGGSAAQVIFLDAAAATNDESVTITELSTDGEGAMMEDHIYLFASDMTVLSVAWLARQGYTLTPPATA